MTEHTTRGATTPSVPPQSRTNQSDDAMTRGTATHTLGTDAPGTDARPIGVDDRAVIAVFPDMDSAERAVRKLAETGFPVEKISIVGTGIESETRINGFVTVGDVAGPSAATGAWVGGLLGVLSGVAFLAVPGFGPLVVLGPLAAGAVGAAEGALLGGTVGAVLGHFVTKRHLPKYEELVRTGNFLLVAHGTEEEVSLAQRILTGEGSTDVQRHDEHRGSIDRIGPIEQVVEGMRVVDADGEEVGKVEFVKLGDPGAVTIAGEDPSMMPLVPRPFAERLLRVGYIQIDRKGIFARDAYAAVTEIESVEGDTVHLNVPKGMLLPKGG
ncbi:hypothetical protein KRR39_01960 [Nocardioides panacis]|uniref:General stress protein 17M-like domain-containing protein n=1 Tax=Nocardioides panacis TaxID=2849501 RepID=A0A975SZH8_9ACTN|nr:general stress protein [Nocardioides panacis]QWZ08652.1 hypothetical protein KRR39_01960 [Nocardioides panacis]